MSLYSECCSLIPHASHRQYQVLIRRGRRRCMNRSTKHVSSYHTAEPQIAVPGLTCSVIPFGL